MKKLALTFAVVGFLTIGLSSCEKCSECTGADTAALNTEYCDDLSDSEETTLKDACTADNGTWSSK